MSWLHSENYDKETIYSAFASDVESYVNKNGEGPRCPVCREQLKASFIFGNPIAVGEESSAKFENTHSCGAKLVIFNT